jgi:hypothetical protein
MLEDALREKVHYKRRVQTTKTRIQRITIKTLSKMTQIEFFVTMKVTCEHDEQGYWGDQTKEQVKETASNFYNRTSTPLIAV